MRANRWLPVAVAAVLGTVPATAAAQQRSDPLPAGVTEAMVTKGKELYEGPGLCFACHGMDGRGSIGADLADSIWIHHDGSFPKIVAQIIKGVSDQESKSGTPMPPRGGSGLSDDEVKAVAAYVWTLSRRRAAP